MSSLDPVQAMDVDGPSGANSSGGGSSLKRCSSAPMINESNAIMSTAGPSTSASRGEQPSFNIFNQGQPRTRRFSASFSPVPGSPGGNPRLTRINQLRQEEHADVSNMRELAHEKELHHTMQISQSWEDLSILESQQQQGDSNGKLGKMVPLHVTLPPYGLHCNSPSPTRLSSPGFQSPTRHSTRTIIRRSASPVLRPSPLSAKRKLDDDVYHMSPRAKRVYSYTSGAVDRTGGLLTTPSSLPGSLSSVGTPESLSSADSPGFFRAVDSPSPGLATKNSGADHDMTEGPS